MTTTKLLVSLALAATMAGTAIAADLKNISTRGKVETGDDVMIAGFVVDGSDSMQVYVRTLGATLSNYGIENPLQDPKMTIKDSQGNIVGENDDWNNNADVIATGSEPTDDKESALVLTLQPGAYTVVVEGVNGATGTAIVAVDKLGSSDSNLGEDNKADDAAKLAGTWFGSARYSINKQICQWQVNMIFEGDGTGSVAGLLISDEIVRYAVQCNNTGAAAAEGEDVSGVQTGYIGFSYQATDGFVQFRDLSGPTFFPQPKGELNFNDEGTGVNITQTIDSNGLLIEYSIDLTKI